MKRPEEFYPINVTPEKFAALIKAMRLIYTRSHELDIHDAAAVYRAIGYIEMVALGALGDVGERPDTDPEPSTEHQFELAMDRKHRVEN